MICSKILHQRKIYLSVLAFLCSLFCCSLVSSQSYAADWYVDQGTDYCKIAGTQVDSSFVKANTTTQYPHFFGTNTNVTDYLCTNLDYNYIEFYVPASSNNKYRHGVSTFFYDISDLENYTSYNLVYLVNSNGSFDYMSVSYSSGQYFPYSETRQNGSSSSDITGAGLSTNGIITTLYVNSPDPEPCPDCPLIPEYPYSDDLRRIYHAILLCGATVFVLWFFKCIYKIVIKDTKR